MKLSLNGESHSQVIVDSCYGPRIYVYNLKTTPFMIRNTRLDGPRRLANPNRGGNHFPQKNWGLC